MKIEQNLKLHRSCFSLFQQNLPRPINHLRTLDHTQYRYFNMSDAKSDSKIELKEDSRSNPITDLKTNPEEDVKIDSKIESHEPIEEAQKSIAQLTLEKKPKQRKGQSEEEFLAQKSQFLNSGPKINKEDWLFDESLLKNLDNSQKLDRVHMLHVCEKAYFNRDYNLCLQYIKRAEQLFGVDLDSPSDTEDMKQNFSSAGRKTKKSSKVERHVVELIHIKESCLKKMN